MNQPFVGWSEVFNKMQEAFHAITVLNVKTMESFTYLKLEGLANLKNPEEFWVEQYNMAFDNGHKALDYIQKSFEIMEKSMLSLVSATKNKTEVKK